MARSGCPFIGPGGAGKERSDRGDGETMVVKWIFIGFTRQFQGEEWSGRHPG
jgi:hypothetical protein